MKRITNKMIVTVATLMAILFLGLACNYQSYIDKIFQGEHRLRKMAEWTDSSGQISGSFFLIFGQIKGSLENSMEMRFAWEMNDGSYAISSIPIEKVRVRMDENAETPTIKFHWTRGTILDDDLQGFIDRSVTYVLITVKESDWPVDIILPMN